MTSSNSQDNNFPDPVHLGALNPILVFIGIAGLLSSNPLETAFAILQLKVILHSYWRQNVPPVILLLFLIPWLEISTGILEASLRFITLNDMLHGSGRMAYWLSAIGLFAIHLGFAPAFKKTPLASYSSLKAFAKKLSLPKLIIAYFAIGPFTDLFSRLISQLGSLYQFVTYLNEISLVLLIVICLRQSLLKEVNRLFLIFLGVATVLSFYSFFSEWKVIAYALFISFGMSRELDRRLVFRILILGAALGNMLFLWQGVKPYYRAHLLGQESLAGGLQGQGVLVSRSSALTKFFELSQDYYAGNLEIASQLKSDDPNAWLYSTLRRVGYLEFFALTLNNVPKRLNHENGSLIMSNLTFALIPRFLNPNKGVKDDGAKVEKYTEFQVSTHSSFSLGHYTEYYIDFGHSLMMVVLFLFGWIGGRLYHLGTKLRAVAGNPLFMTGIVFILLQQWGSYQNDAIFIFGLTFFGGFSHLLLFRPLYRFIINFSSQRT